MLVVGSAWEGQGVCGRVGGAGPYALYHFPLFSDRTKHMKCPRTAPSEMLFCEDGRLRSGKKVGFNKSQLEDKCDEQTDERKRLPFQRRQHKQKDLAAVL